MMKEAKFGTWVYHINDEGQGQVEVQPVWEGMQAQSILQAVLQPVRRKDEDGGVNHDGRTAANGHGRD